MSSFLSYKGIYSYKIHILFKFKLSLTPCHQHCILMRICWFVHVEEIMLIEPQGTQRLYDEYNGKEVFSVQLQWVLLLDLLGGK